MTDTCSRHEPDLSRRAALRRCGGYLAAGALGGLGLWLLGRSAAAGGCELQSPCASCGLRAECGEDKALRYRKEASHERR